MSSRNRDPINAFHLPKWTSPDITRRRLLLTKRCEGGYDLIEGARGFGFGRTHVQQFEPIRSYPHVGGEPVDYGSPGHQILPRVGAVVEGLAQRSKRFLHVALYGFWLENAIDPLLLRCCQRHHHGGELVLRLVLASLGHDVDVPDEMAILRRHSERCCV